MHGSSDVPALRRGLSILTALAGHTGPVSAATLARELELPRSTTYHLLAELTDAGFVVRLPAERRYALGVAAFELGSAYLRNDPLERLAGPLLRNLADRVGHTAHLGVLHGGELLYLVKERPSWPQAPTKQQPSWPSADPSTRPPTLVTEVGVRLPAHLTASGRAMLAQLPAAQVRACFPAGFPRRTARGPRSLPELRRMLPAERELGWAVEDGHVTADFASVAGAVSGAQRWPAAAISVTFRHVCEESAAACGRTWPELAAEVRRTAEELSEQVHGHR